MAGTSDENEQRLSADEEEEKEVEEEEEEEDDNSDDIVDDVESVKFNYAGRYSIGGEAEIILVGDHDEKTNNEEKTKRQRRPCSHCCLFCFNCCCRCKKEKMVTIKAKSRKMTRKLKNSLHKSEICLKASGGRNCAGCVARSSRLSSSPISDSVDL